MKYLSAILLGMPSGLLMTGGYHVGAQVSEWHGLGLAGAVFAYGLYSHMCGFIEGQKR